VTWLHDVTLQQPDSIFFCHATKLW